MPGGIWSDMAAPWAPSRAEPITIKAICLGRRMALTSCGTVVPIVQMLDREGDETEVPDECWVFVAYSKGFGRWTLPRHDYERVTKH